MKHHLAFALPLFLPAAAISQEPLWPAPRNSHVMTWHAGLRQAVLMGGASGDSTLWGWDGQRWHRLATGGPAARSHFAMAYDPARARLVVHGGGGAVAGRNTPTRYGDTWEWDGRTWRRVSTEGPGVRDHHAMAYDPVRRQIVLFGGTDTTGRHLADTWGWTGRRWERLAGDGPPARGTHRLAFDTHRRVLVMFGGAGQNGLRNDTWEWNGQRWTQAADSGPPVRFATRMAYDEARRRTVLFGGRGNAGDFGDTWEWDGHRWLQVEAVGPSIRNVHEMIYDPARRAILLFGGFNAPASFEDLWAFNGAWTSIPRPDAGPVEGDYVVPGPYDVGYRVIDHWDRSRRRAPARDFLDRPNAEATAVPMQISVWYPAARGGTPMRWGEYWAISSKSETLGAITEADVAATTTRIRNATRVQWGAALPARTADSIRDHPSPAMRDARPADGRFPLLVGGLSGVPSASGIGPYLASHGYVVVTMPSGAVAATQEATNQRPQALETSTRNLETIQAIAADLPFVDDRRIGVIGVGFHGLAAVNFQMRNMSAAAVVTLDGQELQTGSAAVLRQSPSYDPARLRVPYLTFGQDNAPPQFAFSDSLPRELKYADRYAYVVRGMDHSALISNLLPYPQVTAEHRLGYDFVWRTVRAFLDVHVKGDTAGRTFVVRSATENGYPAWLIRREFRREALPAIPIPEEVERIAMAGDVARLRAIHRGAFALDSSVRMFTPGVLNLFAFRFAQAGNHATAVEFNELAVEAFPGSTAAANNLGNSYRDAGRIPRAIELWERAVTLIDADPDLAAAGREPSRTNIRLKIQQFRSGG